MASEKAFTSTSVHPADVPPGAAKFTCPLRHCPDIARSVTSVLFYLHSEKADAYLWMGKIYDSRNERAKAIQQYDAILALNCDRGVKSEAQRYKRKPWRD